MQADMDSFWVRLAASPTAIPPIESEYQSWPLSDWVTPQRASLPINTFSMTAFGIFPTLDWYVGVAPSTVT
jgi:hypothetical protein